ncbi:hypothetical protein OG874_24090 [Nocardia sp. NBC_00565]|uniref:hypothetical protein n=1 Tax=Nocardia sp. NBC_00565 TaxID=2975993 RepID=UPI002E80C46D|nr:hypothetical protein [Nocardia sp. NBC_00565]WUB99993.1 hypothetical protein OG874_24090 [Nocardia sp. NBC_00565]
MDTAALPECVDVARPSARAARTIGNARPVVVAAGCLILLQLIIRYWVAESGFFYWDDLILVGRAGSYPLWSTDLLLHNHDGHFMPLAFATAWVVTAAAPLTWAGPVVSLLVLQLGASLAVSRMLIVLVGARWVVLVPLLFYLFCPLTLPAYAWWSAALNALPLQFALAWVIGDAVRLVDTGRRRYAITGTVVLVVALLFFEKSVIVPFAAFAVTTLVRHVDGLGSAIRVVARRGAALWAGSGVVIGCWLAGYLTVVDFSNLHSSPQERDLLPGAKSLDIESTLFGGPWRWERWLPSTPWADPPAWAVVSAWVALGALVLLSMRARRRVGPIWLTVAAYVVVAQLPVALARSGPNTASELMQSLRYFADLAVLLAAAGALLARAHPRIRTPTLLPVPGARTLAILLRPRTHASAAPPGPRARASALLPGPRTTAALTVVFLVSSLWTTSTFVRAWRTNPTKTYVTNVKSALTASDGAPLLDQEVPWNVLNPTAYPQNLTSHVLAPLATATTFADSTPHLRMITDTGEIVEAAVWWNRAIRPGPDPDCGYRIHGPQPSDIPLDGPMLEHEWTAQLNYLANQDGRITLSFEHGAPVAAPIQKGLHTVYIRAVGSGSTLRISPRTPGLDLCLGVGPVGVASYDN